MDKLSNNRLPRFILVRQDVAEHFGVVSDRIVGSFRSQPSYLHYSEADYLIPQSQQEPTQVVAVSRVKERNYGTYSRDADKQSQTIGKDNKKYRIASIEEKESPQASQGASSSQNPPNPSNNMTQSTASSSSSYGINVRGIENDLINYRNPDV